MSDYPNRPESHIIQTKAEKNFELLVPDEWIINSYQKDYGTDYDIELTENHEAMVFTFQFS